MPRLLPLAVLLTGTVFLSSCGGAGSQPAPEAGSGGSHDGADHEEEEGEELAPYMASLQRYVEKLYLAGSNESWELAHFYGEELDEVAEEVTGGGISLLEDGKLWGLIACHHYSGPHAPPYGVRAAAEFLGSVLSLRLVAQVEEAATERSAEAFTSAYDALITACNVCHDATEHGFIKLRVPDANAYPSQDFAP